MFNFLKFEIRGFMSKKVLCYIALCAFLMFLWLCQNKQRIFGVKEWKNRKFTDNES